MHKQLDVKNYFYFEGVLPGAGLMDMAFPFSTYYSGNGGAKFSKKSGFHQKFERIDPGVGAAASSIKARSLVVLNPHVKGNCVFLGRGESLIF